MSNTDPSGRDPWWNDHQDITYNCAARFVVGSPEYNSCQDAEQGAQQARHDRNRAALQASPEYTDEQACLVVGTMPYVGEGMDFAEASTGIECGTGRHLSPTERVITGLCLFIPFVGGKIVRAGATVILPGVRIVPVTVKVIVRSGLEALDDLMARATKSTSRVVEVKGTADDALSEFYKIVDPATVVPHPRIELAEVGGLLGDVPCGGIIMYRRYSTSGPPTLDVHDVPSYSSYGQKIEIKFKP